MLEGESPARGSEEPSSWANILLLLTILGHRRRRLLVWPLAAAVLAGALSFLFPREYTARVRLMPPQQSQGAAAALVSQMVGALPAIATGSMGLKNPSDLYVAMLRSATVADKLIARFHLKEVYGKKFLTDTRKALSRDSDITADKTGLITIEVDSRDPQRAADIANAYAEELDALTQRLATTQAGQRRMYLERQVGQAKLDLERSEAELREAMGTGGLVSVDAQSRAMVETVARLRAQISATEIDLQSMLAYAAPDHPDLVRARQELASLRNELQRLESGMPDGIRRQMNGAEVPRGLSSVRLLRDVKYGETLFEALAKSYELARADEGNDAVVIQMLDRASAPEFSSSPRRPLIVILAAMLGTAAAIGVTLLQSHLLAAGLTEQVHAALASWGLGRRKRE